MNKRERGYLSLLKARCEVLKARIGDPGIEDNQINYLNNWKQELRAMEWAIKWIEDTRFQLASGKL